MSDRGFVVALMKPIWGVAVHHYPPTLYEHGGTRVSYITAVLAVADPELRSDYWVDPLIAAGPFCRLCFCDRHHEEGVAIAQHTAHWLITYGDDLHLIRWYCTRHIPSYLWDSIVSENQTVPRESERTAVGPAPRTFGLY